MTSSDQDLILLEIKICDLESQELARPHTSGSQKKNDQVVP